MQVVFVVFVWLFLLLSLGTSWSFCPAQRVAQNKNARRLWMRLMRSTANKGEDNNLRLTETPISMSSSAQPKPAAIDSKLLLRAPANKLSFAQLLRFEREGHLKMKGMFDASFIQNVLRPEVEQVLEMQDLQTMQHQVQVLLDRSDASTLTLAQCQELLSTIPQQDIPFQQLFHLWRKSELIQQVACSAALGEMAAKLLGVSAVRLYQDSLFVKRPGDGETAWHSDLHMAPFDTNHMVTCWIPLQPVPSVKNGGTGLMFASGSHRDFSLLFWNDLSDADLESRYEVVDHGSFQVGDCSFHHGWCLHNAPPNTLNSIRMAYSVSYIVDEAPLLHAEGHIRYPESEDYTSYKDWIEELGWGSIADHPSIPLVYSADGNHKLLRGIESFQRLDN